MRTPIRWTAALLFAAVPLACSDDSNPDMESGSAIDIDVVTTDLAALLCEAQATCDCQPGPVAADCTSAIRPAVASSVARAQLLGLRYHDECLDLAAANLAALGCLRRDEALADEDLADLDFKAARCKLLAGADGVGDPCQTAPGGIGPVFLGDSCSPGLFCEAGLGSCVPLVAEVGDVCAGPTVCPPGSECVDPDASGVPTCQPPAGDGERCNPHDSFPCDEDLVCSRDGAMCVQAPGPGEACPQGECVSGSFCTGALCEAIPGDGDPCQFFGCADGLGCDPQTTTCSPLPVGGEPCLAGACARGRQCALDGVCVDNPPFMCELPFCRYRFDAVCDEPEGTALCPDDTDPEDCGVALVLPELQSTSPGENQSM